MKQRITEFPYVSVSRHPEILFSYLKLILDFVEINKMQTFPLHFGKPLPAGAGTSLKVCTNNLT